MLLSEMEIHLFRNGIPFFLLPSVFLLKAHSQTTLLFRDSLVRGETFVSLVFVRYIEFL